MSVTQAAHETGVGERRIRRWIAAGRLPAVESPHGKLVNVETVRRLLSDGDGQSDTWRSDSRTVSDTWASDSQTWASDTSGASIKDFIDGLDPLVALVRDQQQTILELSGRCGWLQSELQTTRAQLQAAHERIALLEAPKGPASEDHLPESSGLKNPVNAEGAGAHLREKPEVAKPANAETPHRSTPEHNGLVRGAERPPRRPWWRFWTAR